MIRTTAMGDVALTVPVISGMRKQHPDVEIVMMTRKTFLPFFSAISGFRSFSPDFNGRHKGFFGLIRLFFDLRTEVKPDKIIDLHDVLRSKIIRFLFSLSGIPVYVIDKGRSEKKSLITGKKKVVLKHSVERYADVFLKAGFPVTPERNKTIISSEADLGSVNSLTEPGFTNIGVAPFAKHKLKMWPEEYMIKLLELISSATPCRFFIFRGKEDTEAMKTYIEKVPGIYDVHGKMTLSGELALMSRLDLMISMDSSNMHLAAVCGTKVISIWGGTDPMAGFGAWMQPDNYSIRIPVEELDCRPCTIYGKGRSRHGMECMRRLTPDIVFTRMKTLKVI